MGVWAGGGKAGGGWGGGGGGGGGCAGRLGCMWWTIGGWVLVVAGAVVVLWALLWDRARGRLRCRKCWYRLEGVGAGDGGGVRCPECGRVHGTTRSMRRTRRRWRWVLAAAVLLWLPAYGVDVAPAVRARGWIAAVPGWALAGVSLFLSAEPGSGSWLDPLVVGLPTTTEARIVQELGHYQREHGWLSRRAVFGCARLVSSEALTDGTCARGGGLKLAIDRLVREGRAYGFEAAWARSVLYCEVRTRDRWAPGATVYGELLCRRLISDGYTLDVGGNVAWFDGWNSRTSFGLNAIGGDPQSRRQRALEIARWDHLQRRYTEDTRGFGVKDQVIPLGPVDSGATGPTFARLRVTLYERANSPAKEWTYPPAGTFALEVPFIADQTAQPVLLGPHDAPGSLLERHLTCTLGPRFDRRHGVWRAAVSIRPEHSGIGPGEEVTFGGQVFVSIERQTAHGDKYRDLFAGEDSWWAWGWDDGMPTGATRSRMLRLEDFDLSGGLPWPDSTMRHPGSENAVSVRPTGWVERALQPGDRLVVRIDPSGFSQVVYADLQAERVYPHPIVIPLKDWTLDELMRLSISGVWPDHAMP